MPDPATVRQIEQKYRSLASLMDERMRRQWAASEAEAYGWGGVSAVSEAIGMSPNTIRRGIAELLERATHPDAPVESRIRRPGGGRKLLTEIDAGLLDSLERLVDPTTRGDPQSPLRWTCKSTTQLAEALTRKGHALSPRSVGRLLNEAGYSLQSNRKTVEGASHPDRNAQFEHISDTVLTFQNQGQPVISVDTKKKE
ncbi:MAG: ISAzo13 family transposase, partial [Thermoanaerobaculia bacterium]